MPSAKDTAGRYPYEPILLISLLIEPDRLPYRGVGKSIMDNLHFANRFETGAYVTDLYMLMVIKAPGRALAVNAGVWGFMGLAMGFWQVLVIALPAGLAADWFIRVRGADNLGVISAGYSFYATILAVANGCPLLLMKDSQSISRTAQVDPFFAGLMDKVTVPLFFVQVAVSFLAAVAGSMIAVRLIKKHFKPAGMM